MKNRDLYIELGQKLTSYQEEKGNILVGINDPIVKDVFIRQMVDSIKRIKFIRTICNREISPRRINPSDDIFDPLRAAIWYNNNNNIDEAVWLIFLSIHFGKHRVKNWGLLKAVYGRLGNENFWSWNEINNNIHEFTEWLELNQNELKSRGSFSNHRKYESLSGIKPIGTGSIIKSYIDIVGVNHNTFFDTIDEDILNNPTELFKYLFGKFSRIIRFGRLAVFDFITMLGKIGVINVIPDSPYINSTTTGPLRGAKILYGLDNISARELNNYLTDLGNFLELDFGMQVLEDCVCNWQKDRMNYTLFKG